MAEKTTPNSPEVSKKRKKKLPVTKIVIGAIFAIVAIFGIFYFVQYNKVNTKYQEAILTTEEKNKRTADEVAKLIDLPKDETPIVVLVNDKDKLVGTKSSKAFFEKAQNNDLVLAYQKGNVAVIYRPGEKRIIKSDTYQSFFAATNPITIAVIAPTDQQENLATQLEGKNANVQITAKTSPKVLNGQSYVVDLSGTNAKTAQELAAQLGLTVGTLPADEPKPSGALFAVVVSPPQ